jgi:tellurium resistance protein TerD
MARKLVKNQVVEVPAGILEALNSIAWDERKTVGEAFDLDISAFLCDENDRCLGDDWLVCYDPDDQTKQTKSPDGAVIYSGDNRTGDGDGTDEWIKISFAKLDPRVKVIYICASVYNAPEVRAEDRQTFGALNKASIYIENAQGATEDTSLYVDLVDGMSIEESMVFIKYYKTPQGWKIKNVSQGYQRGLEALCAAYGIEVAG